MGAKNSTDKDLALDEQESQFPSMDEEDVEEIRMISGFDVKEIQRLKKIFLQKTNGKSVLTLSAFKSFPGIGNSPLRERICSLMKFESSEGVEPMIDLKGFIAGIGQFNSPGQKDQKLKIAFSIQDYDEDGRISRNDLRRYISDITKRGLSEDAIDTIVETVFYELTSYENRDYVTFNDFQRVVGNTDFHLKLHLPI